MDNFTSPFNVELGNSISPQITSFLIEVFGEKNIRVFDKNSFYKQKKYEADIASCLKVTKGGSVDFQYGIYTIIIQNGTLSDIYITPDNLVEPPTKMLAGLTKYLKVYEEKYFSQ